MAEQDRGGSTPQSSTSQAAQAGGRGPSGERRGQRDTDVQGGGQGRMDEMREQAGEMASEAADLAQEQASELRDQVRDQAAEIAPKVGEAAYSAVETGRQSAADALERGANNLDRRMGSMGGEGMTAMAADAAADGLHSAAGYLRDHESAEIWEDVEQYVREHPGRSVLAAIAAGVIVGRILR